MLWVRLAQMSSALLFHWLNPSVSTASVNREASRATARPMPLGCPFSSIRWETNVRRSSRLASANPRAGASARSRSSRSAANLSSRSRLASASACSSASR